MSTFTASRRSLLLSGGAAALGVGLLGAESASAATAGPAQAGVEAALTPAEALKRVMAGNERFIKGKSKHPHQTLDDLHALAAGQHPFVITIGCADSRVSPEFLFDQGLGDIFDNRVAGNLVDDLLLGSIEFAVEEFGSPLIVVLGHERCGAVTATVKALESGAAAPGHIGAIVEALTPVVQPLIGGPGDVVDKAVRANVRKQVKELSERSDLIAEHVSNGELRVVGARYDLDTGKVTLLG